MHRKTFFCKIVTIILIVSFISACAPNFPHIRKEDRAKVTREEIDREKKTNEWIGFPILNATAFGIMGLGLGVLIGIGQLHQTNKIMPTILITGLVGLTGGAVYGTVVGKDYATELATIRAIESKRNQETQLERLQTLTEEIKKLDPKRDKKRILEIQDEINSMKASLDQRIPK
jgi:hypothetical protein